MQTHEQLIDLSWKNIIRPFLLHRFPHATEAELERAHSYAYGGCAIQDLGYYPFSNTFFSDLTHYVRPGDFVETLFDRAKNPDELAFAIGALSHYVGDTVGHPMAINPSVGIEFPGLAKRYGPSVSYNEDPHAHVRTEFAFDIDEISKRRMAPSAYLRHVGLRVPTTLLADSFLETYGLDFGRVLGERRAVVRSYRFAVRSFLPRIAYAETVLHKKRFPPDTPDESFRIFEQHLAEADFMKGWDPFRKKAGIGTHLLAWIIPIMPRFGPLSMLAIKGPQVDTHQRYVDSVNASTDELRRILATWGQQPLANRDLDTGKTVQPGQYPLTDKTYAKLLDRLTRVPANLLPPALKQNVLDYFADPQAMQGPQKAQLNWPRIEKQLALFKRMNVTH